MHVKYAGKGKVRLQAGGGAIGGIEPGFFENGRAFSRFLKVDQFCDSRGRIIEQVEGELRGESERQDGSARIK